MARKPTAKPQRKVRRSPPPTSARTSPTEHDPAATRRELGDLVEALWHGARDLATETGDPIAIMLARIGFALSWATERGDTRSLSGKGGPNTWARRFLRSPEVLAENPGATSIDPFPETREGEKKLAAEHLLDWVEGCLADTQQATGRHGEPIPRHVVLAITVDMFLRSMTGAMLRGIVPDNSTERLANAFSRIDLEDTAADAEAIVVTALRVYGVPNAADVFKYKAVALKRDAHKP